MEADGALSSEGCIEMAWMMGLIKHGESDWLDSANQEPLTGAMIQRRYEGYIMKHCGIRLREFAQNDNAAVDTSSSVLHEVQIRTDMESFETDAETAKAFKLQHGKHVHIAPKPGAAEWEVAFQRGATLRIPKASGTKRLVEGQLPTGWNPRLYGVSEDVITQVDPVTLYLLVCTAEAFLAAGVLDPYEFYRHIHISELGICVGTGAGAWRSLEQMMHGRHMDEQVQDDILQETFANTPGAWVNMLFLSAAGPIKTPVGACATALESLESGYETITSGKARVCLVGGFDDLHADLSSEFRNMKATVEAEVEFAAGRVAHEMSRPGTTSRKGFVEAQGCGVQLLTTAALALEMGLPVYGVIAMAELAADKIGRSVPAPGRGILIAAREEKPSTMLPIAKLDISKRRGALEKQQILIDQQLAADLEDMKQSLNATESEEYQAWRCEEIQKEAHAAHRRVLQAFGNTFWKGDTRISPIRGSVAVWGLKVDDIDVLSLHGTSTKRNDVHEASILHGQLAHLGRTVGKPALTVWQKHLTGHAKGAAGAWMVNGAMQMLATGLVPGQRNADNVDSALQSLENLAVTAETTQTAGINAVSLTAFGFGQKGAQALVLHSRHLFAAAFGSDKKAYAAYRCKAEERMKRAEQRYGQAMANNDLFQAKDTPPYSRELETAALLSPAMRFFV